MRPLIGMAFMVIMSPLTILTVSGLCYVLSNGEYEKGLKHYTPALVVMIFGLVIAAVAGVVLLLQITMGQRIAAPRYADEWRMLLITAVWNALATLLYFTAYPMGGNAVMNTSMTCLIPAGVCVFLFLRWKQYPKRHEMSGMIAAIVSVVLFALGRRH